MAENRPLHPPPNYDYSTTTAFILGELNLVNAILQNCVETELLLSPEVIQAKLQSIYLQLATMQLRLKLNV